MIQESVKTINFNKVIRVDDKSITVRADNGKAVKIDAPFDKTLLMREPFCGMGQIKCPTRIIN